jgi:hypothetical protein
MPGGRGWTHASIASDGPRWPCIWCYVVAEVKVHAVSDDTGDCQKCRAVQKGRAFRLVFGGECVQFWDSTGGANWGDAASRIEVNRPVHAFQAITTIAWFSSVKGRRSKSP